MRVKRLLIALIGGLALAIAVAAVGGANSARLGPYPSLRSCSIFPKSRAAADAPSVGDESAWNQDISSAPVDPNSDAYVAYMNEHGPDTLHPDFGSPRAYGIPYAVVGRHAKRSRVHFTAYGDESSHGRYRIPPHAPIEGGRHSDGDRHVLVVDRARCKLDELFNAHFVRRPRKHWNADGGVIWNMRSRKLRREGFTSADAAGLPIFPGLVRYDEAKKGAIHHAIRVTVDSSQNAWIKPASHCAGDTSDPDAPPMGLRLRLRAGYDTSGLTGVAAAVGTALKHYGLIVADNGSGWYISGASDHRWPDGNLNQLKSIPGSAFEVVLSAASIHRC